MWRLQHGKLLMVAVACTGMVAAGASYADPYDWRVDQIQDLTDVTDGFHGGAGQLSTIDSITLIPNGIELGVTFRIGQEADPMAPNYGLGFARVSLQGLLGFPGLDLSNFTSSSFDVTSTTDDLTVQSFLFTDFTEDGGAVDDGDGIPGEVFSFLFWEHVDGVGAGGPTDVDFDFSNATEFDGNWNLGNPQAVQGTGAIRAWGTQLARFSGMTIGEPVEATIRIEGVIPEALANFEVTKDFTDDNPAAVEVTISCNTGLPLEQTTSISEGDGVVFVVVDFADGEMDCEITESVPNGYAANYFDGSIDSSESCVHDAVEFGQRSSCTITNSLQEVEVKVTKVWIDENPQFNASNRAEADWDCSNVASGDDDGSLTFIGNPDERSFFVFPNWDGGTDCSVSEVSIADGGVEVDDSECESIEVFPGVDGACTIVNTRLYEGIPTLSQYGLAFLALLMLGVGFIGFRRLA